MRTSMRKKHLPASAENCVAGSYRKPKQKLKDAKKVGKNRNYRITVRDNSD